MSAPHFYVHPAPFERPLRLNALCARCNRFPGDGIHLKPNKRSPVRPISEPTSLKRERPARDLRDPEPASILLPPVKKRSNLTT